MTIIRDTLHDIPGGDPIAGATVTLKLAADDSTLDSATTDAKGVFELEYPVNPGPMYYETTVGTVTKRHSTSGVQPVWDLDLGALVPFFTIWTNGTNPNYGNALAATCTGSNMVVTVGTGAFIIDGMPHAMDMPQGQTIAAAHPTQPRIDLLYVAAYGRASTTPGKFEIGYLQGTPSASPAKPTPTVVNGDYFEIASVRVDAGVTTIATNKVTDLRTTSRPAGGGLLIERDNVVQGQSAGIDIKYPLYSAWYANDVTDVGVYRGATTPVTHAEEWTATHVVSGSTEVKLGEYELPALMLNQSFRVVVDAEVYGEANPPSDCQIGIKLGSDPIVWGPTKRWEAGVNGEYRRVYRKDVTGTGVPFNVGLYIKRVAQSSLTAMSFALRTDATPRFIAGQ